MSNLRRVLTGLFALVSLASYSSIAFAQFQVLVDRVPRDANTLILFNVEKIHQSPLAQKDGWREQHNKLFSSGLIAVPPDTTQFAMAAQMDIELMRPNWEASVLNLNYTPSMPKVAARFGGSVDKIETRNAAALPGDTYVIQWGERMAGLMMPANRQRVASWIRDVYADSRRRPLTAYLTEAVSFADKLGTPIIMAMDMSHVYSPKFIRGRLETAECLKGKDVDLDKLAATLSSIRGVTLGITIKEKVYGRLKVDFSQDVSMLEGHAKPMILEVLGNRGAMINEFHDWEERVSANELSIAGPLYQSGMQRIFSVLDTPPALQSAQSPSEAGTNSTEQTEESQKRLVGLATQQYYNSLMQLINDLRGKRGGTGFSTAGQVGMWFERYARRIDGLPILNVDRELVDFGAYAANQLRDGENAMKGVGAKQAMRISEKPNAEVYDYRYAYGARAGVNRYGQGVARGGYAYGTRYNWQESLRLEGQQQSRIRTQERIRGYSDANSIQQGLEAEAAHIRRVMTDRYGIEF